MDNLNSHKKFIFNEKIDNAFLFSLYEDDYSYITEVFHSALDSFDADLQDLTNAYENANTEGLKKAVHKIKPVFGFTGLLRHQEFMQHFETACESAQSIEDVNTIYDELITTIYEGKKIIEADYKRLVEFTVSIV
jgi:HPt (histidine-containing phosphotransfer) domain-containing protein